MNEILRVLIVACGVVVLTMNECLRIITVVCTYTQNGLHISLSYTATRFGYLF